MIQTEIKKQIIRVLNNDDEVTLLIHSDLMKGFNLPFLNRNDFLVSHYKELEGLHDNLNIWMPSFNYEFLKDKAFSIENSKSQVGSLSEYFRKNISNWRSPVPVFSFSGIGNVPPLVSNSSLIDPFGLNSDFNYLYDNNAWLMHYGSSFSSSTILHYAERISKKMTYRYDKLFAGEVFSLDNKVTEVTIKYHVRPLNKYIGYDWTKIEKDLIDEGILVKLENEKTKISLCKITDLIDFWILKLNINPYYLLDEESKLWIMPALDKLGRPFLITDFE